MLSEKEKLEEELGFLKESLDANVITKEEYEIAKKRLESKLKGLDAEQEKEINFKNIEEKPTVEIQEQKVGSDEERKEELEEKKEEKPQGKKEIKELIEEKKADLESPLKIEEEEKELPEEEKAKEDEKAEDEIKEVLEEQEKKEAEDEVKEQKELFEKEEKIEEEKPAEEVKREDKIKEDEEVKTIEEAKKEEAIQEGKPLEEVEKEEAIDEKKPEFIEEKIKNDKKIFVYVAVILILGFGLWFLFFAGKGDEIAVEEVFSPINNQLSLIACNSDKDCSEERKIGTCENPGQENAECKYIDDVEIKLTILNTKNCFNCETGRVLSILYNFYPNLDIENVDIESEKGKEIIEMFNLKALPAYIFSSSFTEAFNFNKLASSFDEIDGNFVMKTTVANANYYLEREEIPNNLDLFLKPNEVVSSQAEENLKQFLGAFDGKVNFEKHNTDAQIVQELGLNTFPAFLVNNKIKFSGVQSADKIKENFCKLNKIEECELELSKSLV